MISSFSPTVFEDVAFGPLHMGLAEAEVRKRVSAALDQVGDGRLRQPHVPPFERGREKAHRHRHGPLHAAGDPGAGRTLRRARSPSPPLTNQPAAGAAPHHARLLPRHAHGAGTLPRMVIMDEGHVVADGETEALMDDAALLQAHGLEKP